MTFQIIKGDLFDLSHNFDALAQGVNTKGVMGAGIAVDFKARWPLMFEDYRNLCTAYTDILPGLLHTWENPTWDDQDPIQIIFNLFSQDFPGRGNAVLSDLAKSTLLMRMNAQEYKIERVGLPWIGCGIGGIAPHNAQHFFERILGPSPVEFVLVER
jgi:O-acetyl-ADP-ribose deacetylase (regulator of RNase III)